MNALEYTTKCTYCGKEILGDPMNVPIIGEPADAKAERFITGLAKHLQGKHPYEFALLVKPMIGYITLVHMESEDPGIAAMREYLRYALHSATRKMIPITDDHIVRAIAELAIDLKADDQQRVVNLIRDLRDLLTDSGPYSPQVKSPLVPAAS